MIIDMMLDRVRKSINFFTNASSGINAGLRRYETRVDPFDPLSPSPSICTHTLPDNARAYINYASDRPREFSLPSSLLLSFLPSVFRVQEAAYRIYQKHDGKPVG